ncbi:hypothetical protein CPC08DRAFT_808965 [Agrocybe pediades]|nr:hypothetical protein CPC08DRAFT_808965 [Agrocybe pediades]
MSHSSSDGTNEERHTREIGIVDPKSLKGKVKLDCADVYGKLRINEADDDLVRRCATSLRSEPDLVSAFKTVKEIAEWADNQYPTDEQELYLEGVFNYIAKFESEGGKFPVRLFTCPSRKSFDTDELPAYGPYSKPAMVLTPVTESESGSYKHSWHNCDAFVEVKGASKKSPYYDNIYEGIPEIILHAADSARLHMAFRPFMLYSVCFLVYGTRMCIGVVDRESVSFSPDFNMLDNREELVRVIRALTHLSSLHDLGFDPTVEKIPEAQATRLELAVQSPYASYIISHADPSTAHIRKWCTMGPPLWASPELIGDGSYIFRVRECMESDGHEAYLDTNPVLLKTYWREGAAAAQEASIYTRLQNAYPEGLARVLYGGDVVVPGTKTAITAGTSSTNSSLVLGRMIFQNAGSPLWEYSDEGEFFHGLKSAVTAHQDLCKRGILHRGINPASIFLVENDNLPPHVYGFLLDLQYACIIASSESAKKENALIRRCECVSLASNQQENKDDESEAKWDENETKTLRMAQTKLLRLLTRTTDEIAKNDIETHYACIHSVFDNAFSQTNHEEIAVMRTYRSPALACFFKDSKVYRVLRERGLISETMSQFMKSLSKLLEDDFYADIPATPTHEQLLDALNVAISRISVA